MKPETYLAVTLTVVVLIVVMLATGAIRTDYADGAAPSGGSSVDLFKP